MAYVGTAHCDALYCLQKTHKVCWPEKLPPAGKVVFDCPQTDSEVVVETHRIAFVEVEELPQGSTILRRL